MRKEKIINFDGKEIKPCSICGSKFVDLITIRNSDGYLRYYINCSNCKKSFNEHGGYRFQFEAITVWNYKNGEINEKII